MEVSVNKSSAVSFLNNSLSRKRMIHLVVLFALTSALFLAMIHGCWADDDLLKVGDTTVKATFGKDSSLMTWLLIGEVVMAILGYVATKNFKILGGIIVLSVFINVAFAIIG